MGRFEYSFRLFFSHHIDIYRVGKKYPRIYRAHLLMKIPLYALIGLGLWLRPENMVLVFLLPAALTLLHTCWATYEHHAGLPTTSHFEATTNREHALYNAMSWNLGYHTAHHVQPGLHWSELPRFHEELRDRIPKERILTTFW
jgi:fatty acid desaturase